MIRVTFFGKRISAAWECQQPTNDVQVINEFDRTTAEWILGTSPSEPMLRMTIAESSRSGADLECAARVLGNTVGDVDTRVQAAEACNQMSAKYHQGPSREH